MTAPVVTVEGKVTKLPLKNADDGALAGRTDMLREQGMDLRGFHPDPIELDITPRVFSLVKPLFESRGEPMLKFFPCRMLVEGVPLFGYVMVDAEGEANAPKLRIIGPELRTLEEGQTMTVEMDPARAKVG